MSVFIILICCTSNKENFESKNSSTLCQVIFCNCNKMSDRTGQNKLEGCMFQTPGLVPRLKMCRTSMCTNYISNKSIELTDWHMIGILLQIFPLKKVLQIIITCYLNYCTNKLTLTFSSTFFFSEINKEKYVCVHKPQFITDTQQLCT
jgi:hypothetical protein